MTGRMELYDRSRRVPETGGPHAERDAGAGGGCGGNKGSEEVWTENRTPESADGGRLDGPDFRAAHRAEEFACAAGEAERRAERLAERLGGERLRDGKRSVTRVTAVLPAEYRHGAVRLWPARRVDPSALRVLFPRAASEMEAGRCAGEERFAFFDIETTGLSGGAGTLAFLAGILRLSGGGIRLTQYFLENLGSERLFLSLLSEELGPGSVLVSFNGRCFDAGIIRNRLVLNGFRPPDPGPPHLDLLYPSRRIWKERLPDFTLQTLERRVLGVERIGDIAGWRIPEVYFAWLGARDAGGEIASVFAHNRTDVLSLLGLFVKQLDIVGGLLGDGSGVSGPGVPTGEGAGTDPRACPPVGFDPGALSEMLERCAFGAEARRLLEAHAGDRGSLRRLAFLCKRERRFEEASRAFESLLERDDGGGGAGLAGFIEACIELSKLFEHRLGDLGRARRYAELAASRLERAALFSGEGFFRGRWRLEKEAEDLKRRLHRLARKTSGM